MIRYAWTKTKSISNDSSVRFQCHRGVNINGREKRIVSEEQCLLSNIDRRLDTNESYKGKRRNDIEIKMDKGAKQSYSRPKRYKKDKVRLLNIPFSSIV